MSQLVFDVSFYKTYYGFALCDVLAFYVSCYKVYFIMEIIESCNE